MAPMGTNDLDDLHDILNGDGELLELNELYVELKKQNEEMRKEDFKVCHERSPNL
jgi:hypothetical protein